MITLLQLKKQIEKFIAENPEAADLHIGFFSHNFGRGQKAVGFDLEINETEIIYKDDVLPKQQYIDLDLY